MVQAVLQKQRKLSYFFQKDAAILSLPREASVWKGSCGRTGIYFDTVFDTKGICTIIDGIKRYRTILENILILQAFPKVEMGN